MTLFPEQQYTAARCVGLYLQFVPPGGSTIQGVRVLEEHGLRGAVMDAVIASYNKTKEMGKG